MKRRAILVGTLSTLIGSSLVTGGSWGSELSMNLNGARATMEIDGDFSPELSVLVQQWIMQSAEAVHVYYDRFPVPDVYIHVLVSGGAGVRGGQTFPGEVPLIRIRIGKDSDKELLLRNDWVMVHELVHLAFPWMNLRNNWMAEGLAVYVESIARMQAGHLSRAHVWKDFVKMMPRGLPAPGDGGFDVTVNWGRTYWGGAIFCLLADVGILQQTENRLGLQHALRAINAERDFRREWDFAETLAMGDKATGTRVLTQQYEAMRLEAVSPDLPSLWRELGLRVDGDDVSFDEHATLAATRRAIETPLRV